MDSHSDITSERRGLEKERRVFIEKVTKEFNETYYKKMSELIERCEKLGHKYKFTHFGPLGNPWYICSCCGKNKCELSDNDDK